MATYNISTLAQLQAMSSHLADDCILLNDIDASATATWNPVGNGIYLGFEPIGLLSASPFTGTFNGGGYTISNLYIRRQNLDTAFQYIGLFGYCLYKGENCLHNGSFTGGTTGWTLGASWAYGTNNVQKTADGVDTLSQITGSMDVAIVIGRTYSLTYSVSSITGTVTPSVAGVNLTQRSTAKTFTETFVALTTDGPVFTPSTTARFTIDDVLIYKYRHIGNVKLTNMRVEADSTSAYTVYMGLFVSSFIGNGGGLERGIFKDVTIDGYLRVTSKEAQAGGLSSFLASVDLSGVRITNLTLLSSGASTDTAGVYGGMIARSTFCTADTSSVIGFIQIDGTKADIIAGFTANQYAAPVDVYTQCYANVNIYENTTNTSSIYIGGFIGSGSGGCNATDCIASGNIQANTTVQSVIGGFNGGTWSTFKRCGATGNIDAKHIQSSTSSSYVGGFGGYSGNCTDCYSWGDVLKNGFDVPNGMSYVGGFCGIAGTFTTSYSKSYVFPGISNAGGFSGTDINTVTACFWDKESSGYTKAIYTGAKTGVTGMTTAQMKSMDNYVPAGTGSGQWDFISVWEIGLSSTAAIKQSNLTVWLSSTGDYETFKSGTKDSDSFQLTIPSTNEIRWCEAQESLLIGTAADEWKIASNKLETPLSPTNFGVKRQSGYGSALIQAMPVNEVLLFVDFVRRKIREMSYDSNSNKYVCPDMTNFAEHITKGQVKWISYQKNPDSILWVGLDTGDVCGFVYDREQNVTAWFKVILGGGLFCQSGCVVPGETEDCLYLVVDKHFSQNVTYSGIPVTYNGVPVVYDKGEKVYIIKTAARDFTTLADAFYMDCGITFETAGAWIDQPVYYGLLPVTYNDVPVVYRQYDSTAPTSIITGLDHLEGETVSILGDDIVLDDAVVFNGQAIASLNGVVTPVYKAQVGLAYTPMVQPMRIVLGDSMGSVTRVSELVISLFETGSLKYGIKIDNMIEANLSDVRWTNTCTKAGLFTGEIVVSVPGGFDVLNAIFISTDKPLPLTVRVIVARIERTGR